MRTIPFSLGAVLLLSGACSQLIGLDEYEGGDGSGGRGGTTQGGDAGEAGDSNVNGGSTQGGRSSEGGESHSGGETSGAGGDAGTSGRPGTGGAPPTMQGGAAGQGTGGSVEEGGSGGMGGSPANAGAGGSGAEAGAGGAEGGTAGCQEKQLLVDGEFDLLSNNWKQYSTDDAPLIAQRTFARTGSYVAQLGLKNAPEDEFEYVTDLYQAFMLPYNSVSLTATCWYRIDTLEDDLTEYDVAYLNLYEVGDEYPLESFVELSNLDATSTWVQTSSTIDASFYADRQVTFDLIAFNDSEVITNFYFDSCSLVLKTCD